ncbi:hypothetical protein [Streptomyces sp. NBC_00459]|uniref:hypothetical protein n=1 Tax=Streptomyces sp. NBC_00459 TaxID=2975749 RepID=UPI002E19DE1D
MPPSVSFGSNPPHSLWTARSCWWCKENHNLTGDNLHLYGGGPCDSEGYEFHLSDY